MRHPERTISDRATIDEILHATPFCRVAMCHDNEPHIVPMNFGYDGEAIYIHSATTGLKMDILAKNPRVCVQVDADVELIRGERGCSWTTHYRSVLAWGTAVALQGDDAKSKGLNVIMAQHGAEAQAFPAKTLARTTVLRIAIDKVTGSQYGHGEQTD